jgi:hypothetical protein
MAKKKVVIVGGGLFGCVAAALARCEGHDVTLVSNEYPDTASKASGCVLAPSWLTSLGNNQISTALSVLNQLYQVEDITFSTNLLKKFQAKRVHTAEVLCKPDIVADVVSVDSGLVVLADGRKLRGEVLVAAGVWCRKLIEEIPEIRGLWGASVTYKGAQLSEPRLHMYAPYRQAVAFNATKNSVWFGDGTALIKSTWERECSERLNSTVERAHKLFNLFCPDTEVRQHKKSIVASTYKVCIGARPYVVGHKAGYFEQVKPRLWVSTGGAKNGTVLAAWQAHRFLKEALK